MNNETSYFLFQIITFKKYFYVSLGNNFLLFCRGPLVVEALGNCPVCPPLNPALLTCARKPTRAGLIYRTETTTKNCKTDKLKSKTDMLEVLLSDVKLQYLT